MTRRPPLPPLATLLAFSFLSLACAVETGAPARRVSGDITLDRAVRVALEQNPDLLKALQEIERTRGQVIEIRAQALPHLTLNGSYNQQDPALIEGSSFRGASTSSTSQSSSTSTGVISPDATGTPATGSNQGAVTATALGNQGFSINDKSWNVSLEVRQVLYAGGQVRAALSIARLTQDSSYWSLRDTVDRVISTTRTQFFQVLLDRALINVAEESVQLQEDQLRDQKNRFDAGTVPRFNVLRAEVELANVKPNLIRARNDYIIAELQLAKTLGLAASPAGKPAFNCVGNLDVALRSFDLGSALALARERRPFLKVQRQNILIEKERIKVALAGYKPRVDANAGWEIRNSRLTDALDDTVNGWFFGVTGRWNIFDGLETYGRVKQERALLESARVGYDDSVQQVELEVQQAFANLRQARETIQSQQKNVEQAIEALRLANERLAAGAGTQLDVLDARVALTRARTTELQARADYNKALADFDRATATDTIYNEGFQDPLARAAPKNATLVKKPAVRGKKR